MKHALGKFNEHILEYHAAMTKAQESVNSIAALFYAICNQEKEKRNRIINTVSKYGQKMAHATRNKALLLYNKRRKAQIANKKILMSPRGGFLNISTENLCEPRLQKTKLIEALPLKKKTEDRRSKEGKTGRKLNKTSTEENTKTEDRRLKEGETGITLKKTSIAKKENRREKEESGKIARKVKTIPQSLKESHNDGSLVDRHVQHEEKEESGISAEPEITASLKPLSNVDSTNEEEENEKTIPQSLKSHNDGSLVDRHIQHKEKEESGKSAEPEIPSSLKEDTENSADKDEEETTKMEKKITASLNKNQSKRKKTSTEYDSTSQSDYEEWKTDNNGDDEDYNTDKEEENSAQEEETTKKKIKASLNKKQRKRKKTSTESDDSTLQSDDEELKPDNNGDDDDYEEPSSQKMKHSKKQSSKLLASRINNKEGTNKAEKYPPPVKQKKMDVETRKEDTKENKQTKIDVETRKEDTKENKVSAHLLKIILERLKSKHVNKRYSETVETMQRRMCPADQKKITLVYGEAGGDMKTLLRQSIELTEEEKARAERRIRIDDEGKYVCMSCNNIYSGRHEANRHSRMFHSTKPYLYVCGYGDCNVGSNNSTCISKHTLSHFPDIIKQIKL